MGKQYRTLRLLNKGGFVVAFGMFALASFAAIFLLAIGLVEI
jgi:hypothetical protein